MPTAILLAAGTSSHNDATSPFLTVVGFLTGQTVAEDRAEYSVPEPGTIQALCVRVSSNTVSLVTPVTIRKNRVDTVLTVSFGADETGVKEDLVNSFTVAANDEISARSVIPSEAGTNTIVFRTLAVEYVTSGSNVRGATGAYGAQNYTHASGDRFSYLASNNASLTAETAAQGRAPAALTASRLTIIVTSNARTTTTTMRTRVNGADGNQVVTYAAAETGLKEDLSNTDTLAVGDLYCYVIRTGAGTEVLALIKVQSTFSSTSSFPFIATGSLGQAFNVTNYLSLNGEVNTASTTESERQFAVHTAFTAKQLGAYASGNSITTSATTLTLRDSGVDTALAVSFAAAETGWKTDVTDTVSVASSDTLSYRLTTPNTSGTFTLRTVTLAAEYSSGVSGTGSITVPAVTLSATGTVVNPVTGTGSITAPAATLTSTGDVVNPITGTGTITAPAATIAATGALTIAGTAAVTAPAATLSSTGTVANPVTGTGTITAPAATLSGTGALTIGGTGSITVPAATLSGTGSSLTGVTGSGSVTAPAATLSGSGTVTSTGVTGAGSITAPVATLTGSGTVVFSGAVTGTGAITVPPATLAGTGAVVNPVVLPRSPLLPPLNHPLAFDSKLATQPWANYFLAIGRANQQAATLDGLFVTYAPMPAAPNARVLADSATLTWDRTTPGVISGTVVGGGGGGTPSDTVAALTGAADAGVSVEYSRGDHTHADANRPTDDEKAALVGTAGTPSATNPYVTDEDPRLVGGGGTWTLLTNGDVASPELIFAGGDVIEVYVP